MDKNTLINSDLINLLARRFGANMQRHPTVNWQGVLARLEKNTAKLWSLDQMEASGGEPDVVGVDETTGEILFFDCSPESPAGRRNVCYGRAALDARKLHKPADSAMDMAAAIGIELLDEEQYRGLQQLGNFDAKTSSWLKTPDTVRSLGGALFGDYRFGQVFVYHNGADSYYGARGFRGVLRV